MRATKDRLITGQKYIGQLLLGLIVLWLMTFGASMIVEGMVKLWITLCPSQVTSFVACMFPGTSK